MLKTYFPRVELLAWISKVMVMIIMIDDDGDDYD